MASDGDLVNFEIDGSVAYLTMQFAPHNLVDKPLLDSLASGLEVEARGRSRRGASEQASQLFRRRGTFSFRKSSRPAEGIRTASLP